MNLYPRILKSPSLIFFIRFHVRSVELLSVNINLVAFSVYLQNVTGQIFTLFILTVAAAESAIGLAIIVIFFRNRGSIQVEDINSMKG